MNTETKSGLGKTVSPKYILSVIMVAGIVLRVATLVRSQSYIYNLFTDDAFFYFSIASNIIDGNGIVLNYGIPTDAFHPLYLFLVTILVGITSTFGINAPLYALVFVASVLNLVTGYFIYKMGTEIVGETAGLVGAGIWVLNPYVLFLYLSGMEVMLQVFFLSVLIYFYITLDNKKSLSKKEAIIIGVLVSGVVLSRLDGAFVAVGLATAITGRIVYDRQAVSVEDIKNAFLIPVSAIAVASPYFLRQILVFHRITPSSGTGERINHPNFASVDVIQTFKGGINATIRGIQSPFEIPLIGGYKFVTPMIVLSLFLLSAAVLLFLHRDFRKKIAELDFLLIAGILYLLFYVGYQQFVRYYYILFISFFVSVLFSITVGFLIKQTDIGLLRYSICLFIVLMIMSGLIIEGIPLVAGEIDKQRDSTIAIASDLNENLTSNCTVAGTRAAEQYYTAQHDILIAHENANPEFLSFILKNGRETSAKRVKYKYLRKKRVDFMLVRSIRPKILNETFGTDQWEIIREYNQFEVGSTPLISLNYEEAGPETTCRYTGV